MKWFVYRRLTVGEMTPCARLDTTDREWRVPAGRDARKGGLDMPVKAGIYRKYLFKLLHALRTYLLKLVIWSLSQR